MTENVLDILAQKFSSGNSVPVTRATITREEYEAVLKLLKPRTEPTWWRNVPVVSTGHAPSAKELAALSEVDSMSADFGMGVFVFVGLNDSDLDIWPQWFQKIIKWLWDKYPDVSWVCLDQDGDFIEDLESWEW